LIQVSGGVVLLVVIAVAVIAQYLQQAADAGARGGNHPSQANASTGSTANYHDERRPLGTWERTVGPVHITLTFTPELLQGRVVSKSKALGKLAFDFHADYSVTRDSVLYGVITSAGLADSKARMEDEQFFKLHTALTAELLDQPFSMRCRVDGDVLTVKDIRFYVKSEGQAGDLREAGEQIGLLGRGRYTRKAATPAARTP
jgi:hypothetical protein